MTELCKGKKFEVFNRADIVVGIRVRDCANFSRKQLDKLVDFVKTPQVGGNGLIYCKFIENGISKSSVDKFFDNERVTDTEIATAISLNNCPASNSIINIGIKTITVVKEDTKIAGQTCEAPIKAESKLFLPFCLSLKI